jgi:hypothetical protein
MKHYRGLFTSLFLTLVLAFVFPGCKDDSGIVDPNSSNDSVVRALRKITDNSPSVNSFTPNYNEEGIMALSGSLSKDFYPLKFGQKINLVSKNLTLTKDSTTASGTLVQKFDGELIISGSFQKPTIGVNSPVDTVIHKPFSTTITRLLKYKKIANTGNDTLDWKITSVSLPAGGTEGGNVIIQKLTLTAANGTTLVVTDPAAFFFAVGKDKEKVEDNDEDNDEGKDDHSALSADFKSDGWLKLMTWFKKNENVKFSVELLSTSSDPDLLTITYGAMMNGGQRSKYKFNLVSTSQEGIYFRRVYERNWGVPSFGGRMHAVINALTRSSVYDAGAPVEEKTWGIPFKVN